MSFTGLENFKPNGDGTYGPQRWTEEQLYDWAARDLAQTKRQIVVFLALSAALLVWMIGGVFWG